MWIKERDFLKAGLAAGALAALDGPILNSLAFAQREKTAEPLQEAGYRPPVRDAPHGVLARSLCRTAGQLKSRATRLQKVNDGHVCPRGHLMLQELYDPDRVKVPMKRTNPRKGRGVDPKFVPISWDEALSTIADKIMELRKNSEPEKFLFMSGRYSDKTDSPLCIWNTPDNRLTEQYIPQLHLRGGGELRAYYTEGMWGYRDYDVSNTKYLVIWGCDPTNSNRMVPAFIKRYGDVIDNATVVTVVDPRPANSRQSRTNGCR